MALEIAQGFGGEKVWWRDESNTTSSALYPLGHAFPIRVAVVAELQTLLANYSDGSSGWLDFHLFIAAPMVSMGTHFPFVLLLCSIVCGWISPESIRRNKATSLIGPTRFLRRIQPWVM